MIVGLGIDICNSERIQKTYDHFGLRFIHRCFGLNELKELNLIENNKSRLIASLAKRFAAKEAFVKALGSGFRQGIMWTDIEVIHHANGQPELKVSGHSAEILRQLAPHYQLWVSLSDDKSLAQAVVIIENKN